MTTLRCEVGYISECPAELFTEISEAEKHIRHLCNQEELGAATAGKFLCVHASHDSAYLLLAKVAFSCCSVTVAFVHWAFPTGSIIHMHAHTTPTALPPLSPCSTWRLWSIFMLTALVLCWLLRLLCVCAWTCCCCCCCRYCCKQYIFVPIHTPVHSASRSIASHHWHMYVDDTSMLLRTIWLLQLCLHAWM